MYSIKDKVFLVTGGAAGIGAELTRSLLDEGAKHVAILDVADGKPLESELTAKHGKNKIKYYKCDVTTKDLDDAFDSVVSEFGYIDAVVNNAGIMNDAPHIYKKALDVNVTALITSSLKAYELMRKDHGGKGGTIINISSIAGIFQCSVLPVYCAAKSAVLQFSNCLGMDPHYSHSGVRVIAMCFGCTDTSLLHKTKYNSIDKETDDEDCIMKVIETMPMQRVDSAVKGVIEAFKRGASASTWLSSGNRPVEDITANVTKGYEIMSTGVTEPSV